MFRSLWLLAIEYIRDQFCKVGCIQRGVERIRKVRKNYVYFHFIFPIFVYCFCFKWNYLIFRDPFFIMNLFSRVLDFTPRINMINV